MSEENQKAKIKITLGDKIKEVYGNDSALDSLKKFEEDRKSLLGVDFTSQHIANLGIEDKISDMTKLLEGSALHSTFKNEELFRQYTDPILSSIHNNDYESLQEKMKLATEFFIKPDYAQTIKAADILGDAIAKANESLVLNSFTDSYTSKLDATIEQIKADNRFSAASSMLGLASTIDTDLFKAQLQQLTAPKSVQEATEKVSALSFKPAIPEIHTKMFMDSPVFELPKYEDTIMGKADKQIEHLKDISKYMIDQNEKMKVQHEISTEQNNQIKEQNEMLKNQIEDNAKTSVRDYRTLILSIVVGILISFIIYHLEDKSDTENHNEIKQILETNNNNEVLKDLVGQLKLQNRKSDDTIKELKEQNKYIKSLLEKKDKMNK